MTKNLKFVLLTTTALGFSGSAYAADLYTVPEEVSYVPARETPFTWSGVYFGGHVGGAWGNLVSPNDVCSTYGPGEDKDGEFDSICELFDGTAEVDDEDSLFFGEEVDTYAVETTAIGTEDWYIFGQDQDDNQFGWIYGGQIGINQQYGRLVLGLEWDFSGLSGEELSTTDVFELFDTSDLGDGELKLRGMVDSESDMEWLTTFRGRAGAAMGPSGRFLGYITGGLAVAQVKNTFSGDIEYFDGCTLGPCEFFDPVSGDEFESFSESHTDYQFGYAVGVGGEYAFTNMVSLGLEYLYVGLPWGDERTNTVGFIGDAGGNGFLINQKAGFDDVHMVRAKLNFRFPPN